MEQEPTWAVGRVAKRCGVKVSTLHFYEEKGLIRSWRNQGNQRRYKPEVLRRISVIKAAQKMGVSLDEIKHAFSTLPNNRTPTKEDWQHLSQLWHDALNRKIHQLENLRDSLTGCIGCGCLSLNSCPIYNPDDELSSQGLGPVILDSK
ncbi:redox-sensitive transcriptional activator SoxR [Psychrosphaera algicola]|uniref:Redox-sensitive transcriptional activator SoxR n=1 Tax=Psychrosphaera algicola TaxID=3023714 RepID=A0ABT5FEH8_9GAMM|nr:redox-sensitive transcriptional activator SoxR [Psychrosphaera sp. G1-22]MDC2889288.1 redox-sensitive transcriptional activator SoxR [Psychrosphaera sp. G1-22]